MNDHIASELITKSLAGRLSAGEEKDLQRYLEQTEEARSFAKLSAWIQDSVSLASEEQVGADASLGSLSEVSKERMRRALRKATASSSMADQRDSADAVKTEHSELSSDDVVLGSNSTSSLRRVAEDATAYFQFPESDSKRPGATSAEDDRHAVCRFSLIRKIGEGGLGTVWLARDEKLRRNVAIKEMNASAAENPVLWKRFEREAEITGHLEHPNVVPLYMSGVNPETGLPFYAMRFLGKQTLADAIAEYHARKRMSHDDPIHLHRLLTAFLDVCQAIAYAHSRGVVHRDLKPENVALDSFGQVLVLDWGLAKLNSEGELATRLALSGAGESAADSQTLAGDVVGTPLYMAPEQAAGELENLDERTDVYGLGAILFSILTGNAPHAHTSTAHAKTPSPPGTNRVQQMLNTIATADTPRPRDFDATVPRELEEICLRAMATERFARHSSAEELASEVEGWIAGRHQRQARYENMRLAGRDLRSRLCVQLRQLAVTAQFMVELPPIQGLLANLDSAPDAFKSREPLTTSDASKSEEYESWRERLSKILLALARTKSNLSALSYSQIKDDRIHELLRVERSLQDVSNIRALPLSRLRHGSANTFHKIVLQQFPGEACVDLDFSFAGCVRIVTGVPVFDSVTEEPFGLVLAEAEIGSLVKPEIAAAESTDSVYLVDDSERVLYSSKRGCQQSLQQATEAISRWPAIAEALASTNEYIDSDRQFYATRLPFPHNLNSLRIVLEVGN